MIYTIVGESMALRDHIDLNEFDIAKIKIHHYFLLQAATQLL
jgi:hypothetical protein